MNEFNEQMKALKRPAQEEEFKRIENQRNGLKARWNARQRANQLSDKNDKKQAELKGMFERLKRLKLDPQERQVIMVDLCEALAKENISIAEFLP